MLDRRTGYHHGVKYRYWRGRTRSTDGNNDIVDDGRSLLSSILVGHSTARIFTNQPKAFIQRSVIDLNHQTISIKRQIVPLVVPFVDEVHHLS